ncbi:MAG: hypothetical protein M1825_000841 [Sarcosagium campestre]|nr:MAG: hypothetical protein M1825_000841 [Sarcosagium campestre]
MSSMNAFEGQSPKAGFGRRALTHSRPSFFDQEQPLFAARAMARPPSYFHYPTKKAKGEPLIVKKPTLPSPASVADITLDALETRRIRQPAVKVSASPPATRDAIYPSAPPASPPAVAPTTSEIPLPEPLPPTSDAVLSAATSAPPDALDAVAEELRLPLNPRDRELALARLRLDRMQSFVERSLSEWDEMTADSAQFWKKFGQAGASSGTPVVDEARAGIDKQKKQTDGIAAGPITSTRRNTCDGHHHTCGACETASHSATTTMDVQSYDQWYSRKPFPTLFGFLLVSLAIFYCCEWLLCEVYCRPQSLWFIPSCDLPGQSGMAHNPPLMTWNYLKEYYPSLFGD